MQHALLIKENGESVIVNAEGEELGKSDGEKRLIHILPRLFTPLHLVSKIKLNEVRLTIETNLPFDLMPQGGIKVRRPYPNTRYLVGGSKAMRNGWLIEIPDDLHSFDMTLIWNFEESWEWSRADEHEVKHVVHVTLEPGDFKTYSFDASCWPRGPEWHLEREAGAKYRESAISLLGHHMDEDPRSTTLRDITLMGDLVFTDDLYPGDQFYAGSYMEENLVLPCIPLEHARIDEFQKEQIHERKHVASFKTNADMHKRNYAVDMPPALLLEAIRLTQEIPYDAESTDAGALEKHPAVALLTNWWDKHRPDGQDLDTGFFLLKVRVEDNAEYESGDPEAPESDMNAQSVFQTASANVDGLVLIQFMASWKHFTYDEHGWLQTYAVNGIPQGFSSILKEEVDSGKHDEAWYTLRALDHFPSRFPEAYKRLKKAK